ncbi:uncharacterized protein si:ch211-227n13.3 isoform X2 [Phycodurus eques]|uniref:uncharacterized protein si:ch211-227n13.3 isoform X2 n=1 Tax=Phycodurus eques TaxID=693459 RepID=UPI002ACDD9E1|nr:uncharacterized protein si:ch211-227n13.3 isoform X2 [Phycodurus eques]
MSSPFMTAPTHGGCEPPEIRQVVYSLNCSVTMNTRCSSKLKTASEKKLDKSPNASEDAVQRQTRAKRRRRRRRRRTEFDDGSINKEDDRIHNIIQIINSHVEEEPEAGSIAQVVDRGSDYLDEECGSTTAPSPLKVTAPNKKLRPPAGLCSSCRKFYQRARRLKTPIKDKLLDNDPTSLTCDQWVLLKKWNPSRLPHSSGKLSHCVLLLHARLKGKNKAKQNKQDGHKHSCSRPHLFLQRNLWKPCKVPARKERKRKQGKRPRDDSQGSQIGKQKRLRGKTSPQDNVGNWTNQSSFYSACAGLDVEGFHSGESADENNSNVTASIIPCTFTMQTTKFEGNPPKQKAPMKKTSEFQDLLAQLRGNSSVIVKETQ